MGQDVGLGYRSNGLHSATHFLLNILKFLQTAGSQVFQYMSLWGIFHF